MRKLIFLLVVIIPFFTQAQVITTIAGNGTPGFSGDGAAATAAELNLPHGTCVDAAGNIYITDVNNFVIRKMNTSGVITTIAGTAGTSGFGGDNGPATAAQMTQPFDAAVDAAGNIYFCDEQNNCVRKIDVAGIITTIAGTGAATFGGDGGPATAAQLNSPAGIVIDGAGNIIVADCFNACVRKIAAGTGIITTIAGTPGSTGYGGDGAAATNALLWVPNFLYLDHTGNLYITDNQNSRIRKVDLAGTITTIAGTGTPGYSGDGFAATAAEINYPGGVTMDAAGNMYIADYSNSVIRLINTSGIISTYAGSNVAWYSGDGGPATAAEINFPTDVDMDHAGNLVITDFKNDRIRLVSINHAPHFTGGPVQSLSTCENQTNVPLNSLLAVIDTDLGQTETWSIVSPPANGVAVVAYNTISTGGVLTPVGLYYSPNMGYNGADAFTVSVSDGVATDQAQINVTVGALPVAGVISGIDSVCPGATATLSETVTGGVWSTSSFTISDITSAGIARGLAVGHDTVVYTVINACGIVSAIFPFEVRADCPAGINTIANTGKGVSIFPNPATALLTITSSEKINKVIITNLIGQTVYTNEYNAIQVQVDVSGLPSGIYFVKVNSGSAGLTMTRKFVKE